MEFRLDIIEKELLKLKKSELVQFIISRRLPKKLQNITVVIDFLLANESISCCRCSNGQIIPITFYQSEQAVKCSRSLVEADYNGKPIHWNNRESTITEANNIWTAPIKDSTISKFNLNATVPANEYIFKPPISRNESTVSGSRFLSTALTNDVRKVKSECLSAEENLDLDAVVKLEDPDLNEEKFTTSLDQCKPLIEKGQLQNADDKKDTSDTKVEEIFQCELCSYKTRHKSYIIRHGLTHSEEKPFSCFTCGYKAKVKEQLKIHIRTHTGFKKLSCDLCNYKCSTKPILKSHMQSHTREVEFACSLCDYKTFQELLFNKHIKSRHRIASFQCEICGNTFKIKADLKRHILQHHTSDKPFKCDSCDYTCVARTILNKHNRVIHLREKTLSCDFCDYKCFGKSSLTQHRRIHTGEKPFQCNQCDYKSSIKTQLRIHMRTHTGEKPFACEFCGYRAAFKPNVKLHIQRVHSGEMPFSCKLCDFKSKYHRDLKKHIETHKNVNREQRGSRTRSNRIMELRLDIIEKELLKLKKTELVQFIISRRLPVKLQKITVVIDFLLANESISCWRCSNGQIIPITFYQSEQAVEGSRSLVEANGKPIHWNNRESKITEANNIWTAPVKESTISRFNLNATVPANEFIFKSPISRNESAVSESRFLSTTLTNDVQNVKLESLSAEENLDLDAVVVKIEDPDLTEEKFTTSLDQCKPLIEKGQLQNADDKKDTSDTKVEEIFQCELCSYKTRHKSYIIRHRITHSDAKPFSCFTCGYKAKTKEQLKVHIRTHTGFKKLSCDLCDYKCSTKPFLKSHMQSHTKEVEFACSLCGYKTFQELLFNKHIKSRHRIASFQCEICGNTFKIKTDLKTHILQHHTSDKPFKCDSCDYSCVARAILRRHKRITHLREKKFSCEFCDYKCFAKNGLIIHRRIHTGEKPFQCSQCDYKATIKNKLSIHMRIHTGEKPYACEFCGYRATTNGNLQLHIQRVHSGEMPFSCKLCDFKSKYHRDLKKHIETHINV